MTIPAGHKPADAPPGYTGLDYDTHVPRCECGWSGPRTGHLGTARLNERLHAESCQAMSQGALFDVPESATRHSNRRHVVMPSMGFACGRSMLDDDCRNDPWVLGSSQWCWVTCPDCLALGQAAVSAECQAQQRRQA